MIFSIYVDLGIRPRVSSNFSKTSSSNEIPHTNFTIFVTFHKLFNFISFMTIMDRNLSKSFVHTNTTKSFKNAVAVLYTMLKKGEKKEYRNRVTGFGLRPEDFDSEIGDEYGLTRSKFKNVIKIMEDSLLIEQLDFKGKRDKYYGITPIGLCFLFQHFHIDLDKQLLHRIFDILNTYLGKHIYQDKSVTYNKPKKNEIKNLMGWLSDIRLDYLTDYIIHAFQNVRIEESDWGILYYYLEPLPNTMTIIKRSFLKPLNNKSSKALDRNDYLLEGFILGNLSGTLKNTLEVPVRRMFHITSNHILTTIFTTIAGSAKSDELKLKNSFWKLINEFVVDWANSNLKFCNEIRHFYLHPLKEEQEKRKKISPKIVN